MYFFFCHVVLNLFPTLLWILGQMVFSKNIYNSISYSTFFQCDFETLPTERWGLVSIPLSLAKDDAMLFPNLSPKRQYSFHLVLMGCLLLEPDHHALRKPKHSLERNQGPQHWPNSQLKASTNLPAMWVSHLRSESSSPCFSHTSWHHVVQRYCPCWTLPELSIWGQNKLLLLFQTLSFGVVCYVAKDNSNGYLRYNFLQRQFQILYI